MRVVTDDGESLGILPIDQALAAARARNLDLVEIAPQATPPVAKIMDYGKYIFQEKKKLHESKKKQKSIQVKEVKFRPRIDEHDYNFKKKNIMNFLEHGDKVKATVQFRGREIARTDFGRELIHRLVRELDGLGALESNFEMMGNRMHAIIAPVKKAAGAKTPDSRPKPAPKPVEAKLETKEEKGPAAAPAVAQVQVEKAPAVIEAPIESVPAPVAAVPEPVPAAVEAVIEKVPASAKAKAAKAPAKVPAKPRTKAEKPTAPAEGGEKK